MPPVTTQWVPVQPPESPESPGVPETPTNTAFDTSNTAFDTFTAQYYDQIQEASEDVLQAHGTTPFFTISAGAVPLNFDLPVISPQTDLHIYEGYWLTSAQIDSLSTMSLPERLQWFKQKLPFWASEITHFSVNSALYTDAFMLGIDIVTVCEICTELTHLIDPGYHYENLWTGHGRTPGQGLFTTVPEGVQVGHAFSLPPTNIEDMATKLTDPLRYELASDVKMRLKYTIVRFKGRPVYVREIYDNLKVQLLYIDRPYKEGESKNLVQVHSSSVDLDISSPPLGWVNFDSRKNPGEAYPGYVMRHPSRHQSQGFLLKDAHVFWPKVTAKDKNKDSLITRGLSYDPENLTAVGNTIRGKFLSLKQAVSGGGAVSRNFCFVPADKKFLVVFHKVVPIGLYSLEEGFLFSKDSLTKTRRSELQMIIEQDTSGVNKSVVSQETE